MSLLDFFRKKPVKEVKKQSEPQKVQTERFKAQSRQLGIPVPVRNDSYQPPFIDQSYYEASSDSGSCSSSSHDSGSSSSSYDSCSSSDSSSSCCD